MIVQIRAAGTYYDIMGQKLHSFYESKYLKWIGNISFYSSQKEFFNLSDIIAIKGRIVAENAGTFWKIKSGTLHLSWIGIVSGNCKHKN